MVTGTYVKDGGKMQFWGTPQNPEHGPGTAFHADCCPCDCWSFADDFDRNAGGTTDLGPNWYEVVGKWGLLGYELIENYDDGGGTANSVVMCTLQAPVMTDNGLTVAVQVMEAEVGDKFFIYVHAVSATSAASSVVVEFERLVNDGLGEVWRITIAGSETVDQHPSKVIPYHAVGSVAAYVCTDNRAGMVKAGVHSFDPFAWDDAIIPGGGRYVGLGHDNPKAVGAGIGIRFDNFFVTELRTSEEVCTNCFCFCDLTAVTKSLRAEIFDATGRSGCLGGNNWPMDYDWGIMGGVLDGWEGDSVMPTPDIGGTVTQRFWLECISSPAIPENPFSNFRLIPDETFVTSGCNFSKVILYPDPVKSRCDPLELVFGPYTMIWSDFACFVCHSGDVVDPGPPESSGTFWIRITEA